MPDYRNKQKLNIMKPKHFRLKLAIQDILIKVTAITRIIRCKRFLLVTTIGDKKDALNIYPATEIVQSGNAVYFVK